MKVMEIDRLVARCEAKGVVREVNLLMMEDGALAPGDYVVVNLGYAMEKISEEEALAAWEIYDQMLASDPAGMPPAR